MLSLPVTLKLQVPAHDTASRKLFEAAADHFKAKRLPIRLEVSQAPSSAAALAALEKGDADLAVARAEDLIKTKAQSERSGKLIKAARIRPGYAPATLQIAIYLCGEDQIETAGFLE